MAGSTDTCDGSVTGPESHGVYLDCVDRKSIDRMISVARPVDQSEIRTIVRWVAACLESRDKHRRKASALKFMHYGLMISSIVCSGLASILAIPGLDTGAIDAVALAVSVVSAFSVVFVSMASLFDASGRRKDHLRSELDYSLLARDMRVFLATQDQQPGGTEETDPWGMAVIRFQRRMDNVESTAPPV